MPFYAIMRFLCKSIYIMHGKFRTLWMCSIIFFFFFFLEDYLAFSHASISIVQVAVHMLILSDSTAVYLHLDVRPCIGLQYITVISI